VSPHVVASPSVAGQTIKIGGSPTGPDVADAIREIVVDGQLRLPDRLSLRLQDDDFSLLAESLFKVGTPIEVALSAVYAAQNATVFDGQITTLAPEFSSGLVTIRVIALDRGCLLQRAPRTAAYQDMSYGSIARSLAGKAGLQPGTIDEGPTLAFVQQSNETDWEFLWRLALEADLEVKVIGRQLHFRAAGVAAGTPIELTLGENLHAFTPRVTGVAQVDSVTVRGWDPASAQALEATAQPGATQSTPGISRTDVAAALGTGNAVVVDHPLLNQGHATALAHATASRLANGYIEGEGRADGTPSLLAGTSVKINGVGDAFSGTYAVSGVRHVLRAESGYDTFFEIAGREDRSLLGLASATADPRAAAGWTQRIVVGLVTNNQDPDGLGRVRVKYPALDAATEGWWARLVIPGAGQDRGVVAVPLVGDEVLVAFEHGSDQHPYVIGSVFNGTAKPGVLATTDGTFATHSDKDVKMSAAGVMTLTAGGDALLTTKPGGDGAPGNVGVVSKGDITLTGDTKLTASAGTDAAISATAQMKIAGGTKVAISATGEVTVEGQMISISGTSVKIAGTGVVQISGATVMLG
jgi:phage protein D